MRFQRAVRQAGRLTYLVALGTVVCAAVDFFGPGNSIMRFVAVAGAGGSAAMVLLTSWLGWAYWADRGRR